MIQPRRKLYSCIGEPGVPAVPRALIMENKWRAARYGLNGKRSMGQQTQVPVRDRSGVPGFIDGVVDELDSRAGIEYVHKIMGWQRAGPEIRVFDETGDLKRLWTTLDEVGRAKRQPRSEQKQGNE